MDIDSGVPELELPHCHLPRRVKLKMALFQVLELMYFDPFGIASGYVKSFAYLCYTYYPSVAE